MSFTEHTMQYYKSSASSHATLRSIKSRVTKNWRRELAPANIQPVYEEAKSDTSDKAAELEPTFKVDVVNGSVVFVYVKWEPGPPPMLFTRPVSSYRQRLMTV